MKNKMTGWIIGGLITATTLGVAFGVNSIGNAAPKSDQAVVQAGMMQDSQMMNMESQEMQKECQNMMASPEMQQTMKDMMKQPQMQNMMSQMMKNDPAFKEMMKAMVNNSQDAVNDEPVSPTSL